MVSSQLFELFGAQGASVVNKLMPYIGPENGNDVS